MRYWKELEIWYNDKGELKLHSDFQLDEGESFKLFAGHNDLENRLEYTKKIPKGKYYQFHIDISIQSYKTNGEKINKDDNG